MTKVSVNLVVSSGKHKPVKGGNSVLHLTMVFVDTASLGLHSPVLYRVFRAMGVQLEAIDISLLDYFTFIVFTTNPLLSL